MTETTIRPALIMPYPSALGPAPASSSRPCGSSAAEGITMFDTHTANKKSTCRILN